MKKSKFNIITVISIVLLIGAIVVYRSGILGALHSSDAEDISVDSLSYYEPDTSGVLVDSADHIMPPISPETHKKPIQSDQYDPEAPNK